MAIIYRYTQIQWKLSNKCSVYTAEALAILKTIEFATHKVEANQISESFSTLMSIQDQWKPTDLPKKIHNVHTTTTLAGREISYMWHPGYCNRVTNELADKAANLAYLANNPPTSLDFTYQDFKRTIAEDAHDQWKKQMGRTDNQATRDKNNSFSRNDDATKRKGGD